MLEDRALDEVAPAFANLLAQARLRPERRRPGRGAHRDCRNGAGLSWPGSPPGAAPMASSRGFVLTFDDMTALASAQRMAAWGDVARRIAHEIKNPLTPIQLSADRMRRKFVKSPRRGGGGRRARSST